METITLELTAGVCSAIAGSFIPVAGTREGQEAFCAGYYITAIPAGGAGEAPVLLFSNPFDDMIRAVASAPPRSSRCSTAARSAGGLELAVACEIRVASDQTDFGMTSARFGHRLPRERN